METFNYPVSLNGRHITNIEMLMTWEQNEVERILFSTEEVVAHLERHIVKRVLVFRGKLINIVTTLKNPIYEDLVEEWHVHYSGEWENKGGPKGWLAVSNNTGIVAYFADEKDAHAYRLDKINTILNR